MSDETETPEESDFKLPRGLKLDEMPLRHLIALRDAVATSIRERQEGEKNAIIEEAKRKLAEIGIGPNALFPAQALPTQRKRASGADIPIKYRHGNDTWTGRGRQPRWLEALIAEGRSREEFKV